MATARIAYSAGQLATVPWHGPVRSGKWYGGSFAITAADVNTINNTIALFTVPKGFTITALRMDVGDLDTGAALTLSLGDAGSTARLLSASTVGQAGGVVNVLPAGVLGFRYTGDTDIVLLVAAAANVGQPATVVVFVEGFIDA